MNECLYIATSVETYILFYNNNKDATLKFFGRKVKGVYGSPWSECMIFTISNIALIFTVVLGSMYLLYFSIIIRKKMLLEIQFRYKSLIINAKY